MISPRLSREEWRPIYAADAEPVYEVAFLSLACFEQRTFHYRAWVFPLHLDARFRPGDTVRFTVAFPDDRSATISIDAPGESSRIRTGEPLDSSDIMATPRSA